MIVPETMARLPHLWQGHRPDGKEDLPVIDVLDVLDRGEHPWVALCDAAETSPDFDVVYRFNEAQAVAWLKARLERQGYTAHYGAIQTAYREWPPR